MLESDFWQNKSFSQKIIKEKKFYEDLINSYEGHTYILELPKLNHPAINCRGCFATESRCFV